jgi:long-chain fatty acid transport protein
MRKLILVLAFAYPVAARAGGFEILEQSPQGVATVGAQSAVADDAAAVFYNPAGMAFQPGFGALAGGNLVVADTNVDSAGQTVNPTRTAVAPTLYATQRLGRHFAVGIGSFSNFAEHFEYPNGWNGRFQGTFIDLTTATVNFAAAWRPLNWLALGGGFDVVPGSIDIYQGINFGGGEGTAHAGLTGVGLGGNAGLIVDVIHDYLRFGFTYRSRVDMHFDGASSITAPPEVQAAVAGLNSANVTLALPHNFTWALSSKPTDNLTLSVDVHYTLWSDISTLTLNQTSPTGMTFNNQITANLHDSWAVRGGAELRVLSKRLRMRIGGGWDQSPVPVANLGPILPDSDRVLVGGGLGWHEKRFSVQAGYLAAILLKTTSQDPNLNATYSTVGHVVSVAFTLRFAGFGGRLAANEVAWSDQASPGREERRLASR